MPITGIVQQDEAPVENSNAQNDTGELPSDVPPLVSPSRDVCALENTTELSEAAAVVSSTTVDPDETTVEENPGQRPTVESSVATPRQADMAVLSDNSSREPEDFVSKVPVTQAVSVAPFSQTSSSGFQSAFAAFASASSQIETEAMDVEDSYAHIDSEATSSILQDESSVAVEQPVTSAIDSGLVTTTQESLVTSGESVEIQHIKSVTSEYDTMESETDIYTSSSTAIDTEISSLIEAQPIVESQPLAEAQIPPTDEAQPVADALPMDEAPSMEEAPHVVEAPSMDEAQPLAEAPLVDTVQPMSEVRPMDEAQPAAVAPLVDEEQPTAEAPLVDEEQPTAEAPPVDEEQPTAEAPPVEGQQAVVEVAPMDESQCVAEAPSMDDSHFVVEAPSMDESQFVAEAPSMDDSHFEAEAPSMDESQSVAEASSMDESQSVAEAPAMDELQSIADAPPMQSVADAPPMQSVDETPSMDELQSVAEAPSMDESQSVAETPPMDESQSVDGTPPMDESQSVAEAPSVNESQSVAEAPPVDESQSVAEVPPPMDEAQRIGVSSSSGEESVNFETLSMDKGPSGASEETDIQTGLEGQPEIMTSESQAEPTQMTSLEGDTVQPQPEETGTSDAVYFIQMADNSGEIVTSIIDPNDISSYSDSVVYKQCMGADGQIETTIVNSGSMPSTQAEQSAMEETPEVPSEVEQQVIYAHDLNGHLTPIDSAQSATDVAPPGKQFVYMQDSSGRIIRTIMDANQTMVPGQQVYYTQSDDGRIITSVMDSSGTEEAQSTDEVVQQQQHQQVSQPQQAVMEEVPLQHTQASTEAVTATSAFAIDNSMSGLNMLAELSHLTAGQASSERKDMSATDNNSQDADMDEFRPVAMITRRVAEDGVEVVKSSMANLKFSQDSQTVGPQESVIARLVTEIKAEASGPGDTVSRDNLFVQWQNLDAMCWMDVVLVMLVYSPTLRPLVNLDPSHELASTLLITLLKANRQAQVLLQNLLKNSATEASLQTGAGNVGAVPDVKSSKLVCKENMDEIGKAINILYAMREKIWQALQPRLRCERGKHNSPVLVLPLLVREKPIIKQMFTMNYRYVFKCAKCGYSQDDSHSKILPTIPAVPPDFNMKEPCFVRNCFECQAPAQRMRMKFEGLQDFVQMHFVKGLPHSRFDELSFDHNGDHYEVTGIVHYKNNPDHFIAWVRNAPSNSWMECDDLKSVITRYQTAIPCIPPSQVHMVMWERRLTPAHSLVMRDTEDTKYLASLVLTVQQPTSSQPTPDASSMNQKRFGTPMSSTTLAQAGPASTFLSGLISQSQSSAMTPRGRGGRGSRGPRPRGGITIRRAAPLSSSQMATPRPSTSTQIIRLPVSALPGVNSSSRGSSGASPSPRYILVGGNNAQSTSSGSTGTASKVVVLKSQGGSGSLNNLSAAQLLQLLQHSGALSQTNTRITTQITKPAGDTSSQTQTLVTKLTAITGSSQTDENVMEESTSTAQQVEAEENKDNSFINAQSDTTESGAMAVASEMAAGTTTAQALPSEELPASSSVLGNMTESQDIETTATVTPQPCTTAFESSSLAQVGTPTSVAPSGTIRTLSMNSGEPARYIQIPSSSGGGNIVTQLVMKGGKMVLVPVDKNAQTQPTSTPSIIRLPSASLKSSQLNTSNISSPSILQSSTSLLSSTATTSTASSSLSLPQYITLPGNQGAGNKRTIQFITVPRGSTSAAGGQTAAKTIIVSPSGGQTSSRIVTDAESIISSGREAVSQSGNIVIRELKRSDDSSSSTVSTMAALSSAMEITPSNMPGSGSTVSLLRDVNLKPGVGKAVSEDGAATSAGVSLYSSSPTALTSKPQESFKYILPGSSVHQMSSIQNMSAPQSGPAFTALSSSGTIIGGQLTPTSGAMSVESVGDGTHTIYTAVKEEETILRGQGRGRGQRGRGRGAKTRGRGRQQSSNTVSVTSPQPKIIKRGGTISMLSADLRQVGGQIIESASEDVDGVPVVSIPDFSGVSAMQTESLSAAESLTDSISQTSCVPTESIASSLSQLNAAMVSDPMVITQSIPSIKGNHGFDILTQGILGAANQSASFTPRKSGISLLTGKPVVPSTALSTSITLEATKTQQSLAMGQSVTQNEIETLIKAAQGAAKPPKPGQPSVISSKPDSLTNAINNSVSSQVNSPQKTEFIPHALLPLSDEGNSVDKDSNQMLSNDAQCETQGQNLVDSLNNASSYGDVRGDGKENEEERVVSVDESQVSAAERYRMPTELFQPDDESPEKPVKSDILSRQLSGPQILGEDLPSKLFQDSEMSSQEDDASMSPHRQPKSPSKSSLGSPQAPLNKLQDTHDATTSQLDDDILASGPEADMEVGETVEGRQEVPSAGTKSPGKRGRRGRGRGKGGKGKGRGGRRQSASVSDAQDSPMDASPPPPPPGSDPLSPARTVQQMAKGESGEGEQQCLLGSPDTTGRGGEGDEVISQPDGLGESVTQSDDTGQSSATIKDVKIEMEIAQESLPKPLQEYKPAVVCKRPKVSWNEENPSHPPSVFSYKVLSRNSQKPTDRHPSLGPQPTSFTCAPEPLPAPTEKCDMRLPLDAMVIRRQDKAVERPIVDPSKEPTVIPLVAEEEGDPACTGGSVVTSHTDGEVFTGVIVHKRREMADWSCGLEDEDEERYQGDGMAEDKDVINEYVETLWTAMCMEVGDFTLFDLSDSDSASDNEDESISGHSIDNEEESLSQSQEEIIEKQAKVEAKSSPSGKRSAPDDPDHTTHTGALSPKCAKIAIDDVSSLEAGTDTVLSTADSRSKTVEEAATRVNGISNKQPASNHTNSASLSSVSPLPLPSARSSDKPESFVSPARRSRRTPVPSYKIRDYIVEDKPFKSASKGRRSSLLSSDDDLSGYHSDELHAKKGKKKSVKINPVDS